MVNGTKSQQKISETFREASASWHSAAFADINNRYAAARPTRHISKTPDLNSGGVSADRHYEIELDYFRMVEIGRYLDRDDVVGGVAVTRLVSNILQCGFTLDPKTGDPMVDELIKLLWSNHTSKPGLIDSQQERTFEELAEVVLRDVIVVGDVLALPLETLAIDLIENHRLRTPNDVKGDERAMTIHGVRLNGQRRRVGYWITRDDISPLAQLKAADSVFVPKYNAEGEQQVWHLYNPKRVSQTRGVTAFAACADMARMHNDIQFARLVQQQAVSAFTLVRERSMAFQAADNVSEATTWTTTTTDPNQPGQFSPMQQIAPGMVYTGLPGEVLKAFGSNVPSPTFFDHASAVQQLLAVNLHLPRQLLMLDASETNFSGWRGALDQAKLMFRNFQRWFARRFHSVVYRWLVDAWSEPRSPFADPMLTMARARGVNVFGHEWIFPGWPYVQPLEDASADLMESRNALTSMRRVHNKRSADWTVVADEIVEDNALIIDKAMAKALELQAKYGLEVNWQQLAALPMPDGLQVSVNANASGQTPQTAATGGQASGNQSTSK